MNIQLYIAFQKRNIELFLLCAITIRNKHGTMYQVGAHENSFFFLVFVLNFFEKYKFIFNQSNLLLLLHISAIVRQVFQFPLSKNQALATQ